MPDPSAIEAYYDGYSTWYEDERREGYYSLINDLEFDIVEQAVTGRDALEIGCGTGLILERTHAVARAARGIDLSHDMAAFSARRKGLVTTQASAQDLPFADASFDVIYSFKVLPHVPDLSLAMAEVDRVLRPGGSAFLEVYNPVSLKWLANTVERRLGRGKPVYVRYDTSGAVRRALPPGLSVRSWRGVRIFAPTRHFYTARGLSKVVARLETRARDTVVGRLGGYLVVELEKVDGAPS